MAPVTISRAVYNELVFLETLIFQKLREGKKKINSTVIRQKFSNCKLQDFYFYTDIFGHVLHEYPLYFRIIFVPFGKQCTFGSNARTTR